MHVAIVMPRGKMRAMNVVKVVDTVEICLDAVVNQTIMQFRWNYLTTSGCSLTLQFFKVYADETQEWTEPS